MPVKSRKWKKRTYTRKRRTIAPRLNSFKNTVHSFKRVVNFCNIAPHSTTGGCIKTADSMYLTVPAGPGVGYGSGSLFFTIGDLPDYTEFTSLFDRYMIMGVQIKIIPYCTTSEAQMVGQTNPSSSVIMHSIIDYDDTNVPAPSDTGVNLLREFSTYKVQNMNLGKGYFKRYLRPRIAVAAYNSGVFNGYANLKSQWCDAATPSVQHYGFKYVMETFNGSGTSPIYAYFKMEYTMYFKCKDLR